MTLVLLLVLENIQQGQGVPKLSQISLHNPNTIDPYTILTQLSHNPNTIVPNICFQE